MEMFKLFGFLPIRLIDLIDISLVALIFYMVYLRIKDTRAMQLITGLLILVAAAIVSEWAELNALNRVISFFRAVWLVGIVIIFTPELRRLLLHIGRWRGVSFFVHTKPEVRSIDEVVTAARKLSEKNYGALIVMARNTQLGTVIDTGTPLNSSVSHQLLVSIFTPGTPLHDLAVVVKKDRISAANCLLPLSDRDLNPNLGSRHRAAVGITEETDAVVVVVSEETRAISLAVDGQLLRNLPPSELRNRLITLLA